MQNLAPEVHELIGEHIWPEAQGPRVGRITPFLEELRVGTQFIQSPPEGIGVPLREHPRGVLHNMRKLA